jgi:hypothetical protein
MVEQTDLDRRSYLKTVGGAGAAAAFERERPGKVGSPE